MNVTSKREIRGVELEGLQFQDGSFFLFAKERVRLLTELGVRYTVAYEETQVDEKWKVKAILTIYDIIPMTYENFAIRGGDFGLESAATISLSRAIAIAGYGNEYGISTAEGYQESQALKPKNAVADYVKAKKDEILKDDPKPNQEPTPTPEKEEVYPTVKKNLQVEKPKPKVGVKKEAPKNPDTGRPLHPNGRVVNNKATLEEKGIHWEKLNPKMNDVDLVALVRASKTKADLEAYVEDKYGSYALPYVGVKKVVESLRTTLPQPKKGGKPKKIEEKIISSVRTESEVKKILSRFKKGMISDVILINKLKYAGITEYKSLKDFANNAETEMIEMVLTEFDL